MESLSYYILLNLNTCDLLAIENKIDAIDAFYSTTSHRELYRVIILANGTKTKRLILKAA